MNPNGGRFLHVLLIGGQTGSLTVVPKSSDPKETLLETGGVSCNWESGISLSGEIYAQRTCWMSSVSNWAEDRKWREIQTGEMGEWLMERTTVKQECASLPTVCHSKMNAVPAIQCYSRQEKHRSKIIMAGKLKNIKLEQTSYSESVYLEIFTNIL